MELGGVIAPHAFKLLGLDVIELYSEVNGNFPNHHPDTQLIQKNLKEFRVDEDMLVEEGKIFSINHFSVGQKLMFQAYHMVRDFRVV